MTEVKSNYKKIYGKSDVLSDVKTMYCSGCGHGLVQKLISQTLEELEIQGQTIIMAPVGCSVTLHKHINIDSLECTHGRAAAMATGLKKVQPNKIVISYQGDGDLLSIGLTETLHAANRGEPITVIFINNATYGMTGGQISPTTIKEQASATYPAGRPEIYGENLDACKLISGLAAPYYVERTSVHDVKGVRNTKKCIKKALEYQLAGRGYSFIEILSMCPTGWNMTPVKASHWIENKMLKTYPTGKFRDKGV